MTTFLFCLLVSFQLQFGLLSSKVVLFIVADDLGWGDVNFTRSGSTIKTPNINTLASSGVILSNYYVECLCTQTRSAILSSKYPIHTGLQHGVIEDAVPNALPIEIDILPQILRDSYSFSCHMIGKWHLGFYKKEYTPERRGFDTFYGYYTGNAEYWNHTSPCWHCGNFTALDLGFHNETYDYFDMDQSGYYSTILFTVKTQKILSDYVLSQNENDLFIYLAYEGVHGAASCDPDCDKPYGDLLQAPEYYINEQSQINNYNRQVFGGMLGAVDDGIRNITLTLNDLGLLNDTLIIFTSDNGAPSSHFNGTAMSNYPLRGAKGQLWEGGVRVPAFITHGTNIEINSNNDIIINSKNDANSAIPIGLNYTGMMHGVDWLPSLIHYITNQSYQNNGSNIDGLDLWIDVIKNHTSSRTEMLINIDPISNVSAIRQNNWKLLQGMAPGKWWSLPTDSGVYVNNNPTLYGEYPIYLFDIENDPCERNDVSSQNSQIVNQLLQLLQQYRNTMIPPQSGIVDPNAEELITSVGYWYSWQS